MTLVRNSLGRSIGSRLIGLAAAAAVAAMAFASAASAETTLEKIKREGTIKIGIFNEVPAGYVTEDGKITGESPEVLRAVLDDMGGIEMEAFITDEFGALIPGLIAGRFDIIAAGLYINPKRCEQVGFTRPTARYGEAIVVLKGNPMNIHSYEDVRDNPAAIMAAATGGMQSKYSEASGIPSDRILLVPNYPTALAALRSGRAHAVGAPATVAQAMLAETGEDDVVLADPFVHPTFEGKEAIAYAGLAVRKGDEDLLAAINGSLDKIVNTPMHLAMIEPFG
ncbi:MAG: ectoine/hydroxyectoine ABC transporter substrate-binding protein EhuB, partial [Rhodospirillaceae bacterium]|nr:ectoine/hydroxyectoine ABC transporter substrate-binding protein EhuB [Rhodospirillaceae bacterium]